jgi:ribulose-5-phosphate 4-epimerase/fuculose-1-phosphate aldolase
MTMSQQSKPAGAPKSGGPLNRAVLADLAAASRILAAHGVVDAAGHVSMRHPDCPDRYLMSAAMAPALVTPADIVEYSLDSEPCDDNGRASFLERFIHGEIYKARPDIQSIVHSHSPAVIPFGLVDARMAAMFHNAAFLAQGVPVFDISRKFGATDMVVGDRPRGAALAQSMGDKDVALMRAHGVVACGPNLQMAVFRAVYTEVNARIQHWTVALGGGKPMAALSEEEGRLADILNKGACLRAWELWRRQVRAEVAW